jgi:RNAse (barnase) inhibitor barstar
MENLLILEESQLSTEFTIIEIDGRKTQTLRTFYEEIARILHFPDYFGFNLDSFDELLNDLSWIEDEKLLIYIKESSSFLINERNETKVLTLLDILDATCEDWKWMEPNETLDEDEEDYIPKKSLLVAFAPSQHIVDILNKL